MIICHPEKNDIPALKQMWKSVFGDTDEYIELFFSRVFTFENSLVIKDNKVISMVFFPEYRAKICGIERTVGYICGAATLPEYRKKGLMGKLLFEAHNIMMQKGYSASVLIPASESLFDYYAGFGYEKRLSFRKVENAFFEKGNKKLISETDSTDEVFNIYSRSVSGFSNIVLQSRKTLDTVMKEYEGTVYIYSDSCVIFAKNKEALEIDEVYALTSKDAINAVKALLDHLGRDRVNIHCNTAYFENMGECLCNGMIKLFENICHSDVYMRMMLE